MKQIFAYLNFVVLSVFLFSCNLEEVTTDDKKASFLTTSDGTRCIRLEDQTCVTEESIKSIELEGIPLVLPRHPDCFLCSDYFKPYTFPEVEGFEFEWGYIQTVKVQYRTLYRPGIQDAPETVVRYKYINTISKTPVEANISFDVHLYWQQNNNETKESALNLFTKESSGEFLYIGKQFECKDPDTCDELFSFKDKEPLDICSATLNFKFQDSPEQNLILESMETNECLE